MTTCEKDAIGMAEYLGITAEAAEKEVVDLAAAFRKINQLHEHKRPADCPLADVIAKQVPKAFAFVKGVQK